MADTRSKRSFMRWTVQALSLCLALAAFGAVNAEAKKKEKSAPPPDLPSQVAALSWKLRGLHMDESGALLDQIEKLAFDHVAQWLGDRNVSSVELRRELENVFAKVRYPIVVTPKCFAEPWKGGVLIAAGYSLGWTRNNRSNHLALFDHRDGETRLVTRTRFVPFVDLNYEFVPARGADDFRFFVWGTRLGKSHPRLSAILYAYDGQELRQLWETRDVYDGRMEFGEETVIVRFLKEQEYAREILHNRKPPRYESVYRLTPAGLEFEVERAIPF